MYIAIAITVTTISTECIIMYFLKQSRSNHVHDNHHVGLCLVQEKKRLEMLALEQQLNNEQQLQLLVSSQAAANKKHLLDSMAQVRCRTMLISNNWCRNKYRILL